MILLPRRTLLKVCSSRVPTLSVKHSLTYHSGQSAPSLAPRTELFFPLSSSWCNLPSLKLGSGEALWGRTAVHPPSQRSGTSGVSISCFIWLLPAYSLLKIVSSWEILMVLKVPLDCIAFQLLRGLHGVSMGHANPEGNLGMGFPWRYSPYLVLSLGGTLSQCTKQPSSLLHAGILTRNTRS